MSRHREAKTTEMEKRYIHAKRKHTKTGVDILICDKKVFRINGIIKDREEHFT